MARLTGEPVVISVQVRPNATRNEVVGFADGVFQVMVAAPPVRGKANRELIAFLSQVLGVGKSRIEITRGHTSRNKLLAIQGVNQQDIMKRLLYDDSPS